MNDTQTTTFAQVNTKSSAQVIEIKNLKKVLAIRRF